MKYKMLRSNVLLKPAETMNESKSGLILSSGQPNVAEVTQTGSEVKEIKVGDKVRYDKSSTVPLGEYLMCREADVLCVIEEDKQWSIL